MGARVPAVPNLKSLAFGPVQLSRYLQSLEDDFGPRFATHEFWGRDGGLEEYGGQRQLRTKVRLRIPGASWRAALAETLEPMLATPRNVLTHPVYGRKKMVIKSPVRGSMDFVREGACYAVELLFVEAAADVRLSSGASGVSAAAARTTDQAAKSSAAFNAAAAALRLKYKVGAFAQDLRRKIALAEGLVSEVVGLANEYSAVSVAQFAAGTLTRGLDVALAGVQRAADAAILSTRKLGDRSTFETVMSLEETCKAARDLRDEVEANLPVPIVYIVWETTSLELLVQQLYPGRTVDQNAEIERQIMRMNSLPRYDVIPIGTKILRPSL